MSVFWEVFKCMCQASVVTVRRIVYVKPSSMRLRMNTTQSAVYRAPDNSIAYWWRTEILAMQSPPVGFHDGERQSVRQPIRWPLRPRCYILRTVSQPARPIYGLPKCETRTATTARHANLLILEADGFPLTVEALVFCMYEMAGQPQAIHWLFGIPV